MNNKKEIIEESTCIVDKYGNKRWYNSKGEYHRENDLPAIECANGSKSWYLNGKRNREKGPAIEYFNGDKYWWLNGKIHRETDCSIELNNGIKYWYWCGKKVEVNSQEEFEEKLPYLIIKDLHNE